jgi:7,8-dihydropterin-6-yl-methyl-4-(beta-D-ribofuranosyl)aminobenzene 5'-phosphate synthase
MNTRITIVYDNTSISKELQADWGLACYIEFQGLKILFDTGTKPHILLSNLHNLHIAPESIDMIFVSHQHGDHMGGLFSLMDMNKYARIFVPIEIGHSIYSNEVKVLEHPTKISTNIYSSGLLHCEGRKNLVEQSLFFHLDKRVLVIVGCSHSNVKHILNKSKDFGNPFALIGGLHGFDEFDLLKQLDFVCPIHCTKHIKKIQQLFPEKYVQGGVGTIIEF